MRDTRSRVLFLALVVLSPALLAPAEGQSTDDGTVLTLRAPVVVNAAAVAQTDAGLVGSVATISISVAENGSGHIFIDTVPLTQVDMQGSARLAVKVAGAITGVDTNDFDFFFVVRSNSQVIGGPSAGGIMTVGTIAALKNWKVDPTVMLTGTINPDGSIGPVGGVPEKASAAADAGARVVLFPSGQESVVQSGRVVDMTTYCRESLRISCRAVTDVEEAVGLVTGHAFERRPVPMNVTADRFRAVLGPLSQELLANATATATDAREDLAQARASLPPSARDSLQESILRANESLDDALTARANAEYYTTASEALQASIEARYVRLVIGFFRAEDPSAYSEDVFDEARSAVEDAASVSRAAEPQDETQLQAVGAAQVRASEAEDLLASARNLRENATSLPSGAGALPAHLESLYNLAFAVERSRTVSWWLRIGDAFGSNDTSALDRDRLQQTALDGVEAAEEAVTYAELMLQESGAVSQSLSVARRKLDTARRDYNDGLFVAAMFEAAEAEVYGSLSLELLGYTSGIPDSKVDRARTRAAEAITRSRDRGVEPILAESYFEFAETLAEPSDRIARYNLARTIARISQFMQDVPGEPRPSRFVGEAGLPPASTLMPASEAVGLIALGLAAGAGVMAFGLSSRPPREPRPRRDTSTSAHGIGEPDDNP